MSTEKEVTTLTDDLILCTAALLEKIAFAIRSRNVLLWTEQEAAIAEEFARRLRKESATVIATTELEALRRELQVLRDHSQEISDEIAATKRENEALKRDAARAKRNAGKFASALLGNILDEIEAEKGIDGMNWLMDQVEPELQAIANRLAGVFGEKK